MLVLHEKATGLAGTASMETVRPVGYQRAGNGAVSLTRADESDAASLPKALDGKQMDVKGLLMQGEAHLRSMQVKRQANRRRLLVAL